MVDGDGGPLGAVMAGANVPDFQPPEPTVEAIVVERPDPERVEQHACGLCWDRRLHRTGAAPSTQVPAAHEQLKSSWADPQGAKMSKFLVKDIVGTSTVSFSHAMKVVVEDAKRTLGRLEGVEVAPPWTVALNDEGEVEFRTTVRILYRARE